MMPRLFAALAVLLLYGQCYAESTSGSKVEYYLLNTSKALIKHRPGLKNYVTFNDEQMSFTLAGSSGDISGYLISETGNLEMVMEPIDLEANLTGHQNLSFNLSGVAVDFDFLWSIQKGFKVFELKVPFLKKNSSQKFRTVGQLELKYYQNGEFSAVGISPFEDESNTSFAHNENLPGLKGIAAKDGKKLISFTLLWTNQESDFQLNFAKGIFLAKIKSPTSSKPSDGSSFVLGQNSPKDSTTEGAASAGFAWYWILIIGVVAIFLIVGPITIAVIFFGIMWFEKKKASKNSDPSPNLTPGTSATPATAPPNEEPELQLQSTQSLSVAPPPQAADGPTDVVVAQPNDKGPAKPSNEPSLKTARADSVPVKNKEKGRVVKINGYYVFLPDPPVIGNPDAQKEAIKAVVADKNGQAKKPPTPHGTTAVPDTGIKDSFYAPAK